MADIIRINDSNYRSFLNPIVGGQRKYTGYMGMGPGRGLGGFEALGIPLIPKSEWADIARQRQKERTRLKDFCLDMGLTVLDQSQTNFCWVNAPTYCAMVLRLQETGQLVRLSPASVGAKIKNFRNVGGWGREGLDGGIKWGFNLQQDWPANAINRSYDTDANRQKALQNRIVGYYRLRSGQAGWPEVVSCILAGIPVAVGYDWWRHEVTATDLQPNEDLDIANSWGPQWSEHGFGVLSGGKRYPDDAVAITAMMAT
jgi:hypothetical protein